MPRASSRPARRRRAVACVAAWIATSGCTTLSIPQERNLGEQVNREVRQEVTLVKDEVVVNYVRSIGERILAAAGSQPFHYRFYVVDADEINAFALPAGYIYVNSETIVKAHNVSELAGVIGHEVGHVVHRHVAENYSRAQGVGIARQIGVITAAVIGGRAAANAADLGGGLAAAAYLNTYGREAERESDSFAVEVLPRAGYDPRGLTTFFETLMHESEGSPPAFLSSHPATEERIENTRREIASANLPPGLKVRDGGRLEIIQKRILLLRRR